MKLETWLPTYHRICNDFGFDQATDVKSARLLAGILKGRSEQSLTEVRKGFPRSVHLFGGGPGLADQISQMTVDGYVVSADSATSTLIEAGIRIDMIVTDLDGIVEDQIDQNAHGSAVFVHAHGDNVAAVQKYAGRFAGITVGTCQCPPPAGVFNFGGFTDGDRAACICAELGATRIVLAGFDFENPSDKLGKKRDVKKRKLAWAKVIMDQLAGEGVKFVAAEESEFRA